MCSKDFGDACFKSVLKTLFNKPLVETQIRDCIKASFDGDDWTKSNNKVLKKEREHMNKVGVYWFPSVLISNLKYREKRLDKVNLHRTICNQFTDSPKECSYDVKSDNTKEWNKDKFIEDKVKKEAYENSGLSGWAIALIIVICLAVSFASFLVYRRFLKRNIESQIQQQTSDAVSNYFALRDDETSTNRNNKL